MRNAQLDNDSPESSLCKRGIMNYAEVYFNEVCSLPLGSCTDIYFILNFPSQSYVS